MGMLDSLTSSEAQERLTEELRYISDRRLPETFLDSNSDDLRKFPITAELVERLDDDLWASHPPGALIAAVRRGIGLLSDADKPKYCVISWRRIALILFGFEQLPRKSDGKRPRYDDYLAHAYRESRYPGVDRSFRRDVVVPVRRELAGALLKLKPRSETRSSNVANSKRRSSGRRSFIDRPMLERAIQDAFTVGEKIVLLWGDAGTGKSRLALEASRWIAAGPDVAVIDMASPIARERSLVEYLSAKGKLPACLHVMALSQALREHLGTPGSNTVLVLDNIQQEADAADLIPTHGTTRVLITSNKRIMDDCALQIQVSSMSHSTAISMVRSRLPQADEEHAARLAAALGGRPLAIEHACGYLASTTAISIDRFIEGLQRSLPSVLDDIEREEPSLVQIYRLTLDRLNAKTLRMVDVILLMDEACHDTQLAGIWAKESLFVTSNVGTLSPEAEIGARAVLETLEKYGWIDLSPSSQPLSARVVHMHPLTRRILAHLRESQCLVMSQEILLLACNVSEAELLSQRSVLSFDMLVRARDAVAVASRIVADAERISPYPNIAGFIAVIVRWATESGACPELMTRLADVYSARERELRDILQSNSERNEVMFRLRDFNLLGQECVRFIRAFAWPIFNKRIDCEWAKAVLARYPRTDMLSTLMQANAWRPAQLVAPAEGHLSEWQRHLLRRAVFAQSRDDGVDAAFYYFALATTYFDFSDWLKAYEYYHASYQLYASATGANLEFLEDVILAGVRIVKCLEMIDGFDNPKRETIARWIDALTKFQGIGLSESRAGRRLASSVNYTLAGADRMRGRILMAHYFLNENEEIDPNQIKIVRDAYDNALLQAGDPEPKNSFYPNAKYGRICLSVLDDSSSAYEEFLALRDEMKEWKSTMGIICVSLL